jgi:hypothetical protein
VIAATSAACYPGPVERDESRESATGGRPRATRRSNAALATLLLAIAGCGEAVEPASVDDIDGFWFDITDYGAWRAPTEEQSAAIRQLEALGYADGYEAGPQLTGVLQHAADACEPGLNLWSSGHAPEAFLMKMDGEIVHTWRHAYGSLPGAGAMEHHSQNAWRRVRLLPGGDLLAIHEGLGLLKLDRESNLQWYFPGHAHHDLDLRADGRILVLTRAARMMPGLHPTEPIFEDSITTLDADGNVLEQVSLLACLRDSSYSNALRSASTDGGDILHTNSIDILDAQEARAHPRFEPGHVLVCFRDLDAIATVDLERRTVVWMSSGDWIAPHDVSALGPGALLIFDNMGNETFSKVLEFDPQTGSELWSHRGSPAQAFFSIFCGTAARLPGGNTLITESCRGRVLEVDAQGAVAWEYASPYRAGDRQQFVAALYEMVRLPADTSLEWLEH